MKRVHGKGWKETTSSHPKKAENNETPSCTKQQRGWQAGAFRREGMRDSGWQTEGFIPENLSQISALSSPGTGRTVQRCRSPGEAAGSCRRLMLRIPSSFFHVLLPAKKTSEAFLLFRLFCFLGFFPVSPQLS